jgi:hypothetical protein
MHNVLSNRNRAGVAWPGDVAVSSLIQRLSVIGTNLCKRRTAVQSKETLRGRSLEYRSGTMKHHAGSCCITAAESAGGNWKSEGFALYGKKSPFASIFCKMAC